LEVKREKERGIERDGGRWKEKERGKKGRVGEMVREVERERERGRENEGGRKRKRERERE